MKNIVLVSFMAIATILTSCNNGTQTTESSVFSSHSQVGEDDLFDLHEIQDNGELIVLTLYGPVSYFEFRGENFGSQYMLADEYANSIGVSMRVDVCRSQSEMIDKLKKGDGDIIAYNIAVTDSLKDKVTFCGAKPLTHYLDSMAVVRGDRSLSSGTVAWAVRKSSVDLSKSLVAWMNANESRFFDMTTLHRRGGKSGKYKSYAPRRKVAAPILNIANGQISVYDHLFRTYSSKCNWDWRLLAAQAYQESGFDPNAVSWMGALGLMQLMPSTAVDMGVGENEVFSPEASLRGAVRLIAQLDNHYSSITNSDERINFILAAYNAGPGHVDDARALCKKNGRNENVWRGNVDSYVLRMSEARYYNDPVTQHGYFRGRETYDYVNSIRTRWNEYKTKIKN
jgi:membrane-bound lytic murein transglycosylase F